MKIQTAEISTHFLVSFSQLQCCMIRRIVGSVCSWWMFQTPKTSLEPNKLEVWFR